MKQRQNIILKTSLEVFQIRKAAEICEKTLKFFEKKIQPGISTGELDSMCRNKLEAKQDIVLQSEHRSFPGVICTSINNVAVHGIPSDRSIEEGDLISIDISVSRNGWYGDAAWTYIAGDSTQDKR
jgi:methionyl aminopeptidase